MTSCAEDVHHILLFPLGWSISLRNNFEVVAKPQIMFESKASRELKTERTRQYVSISIRGATLLSDIRWGFAPTSRQLYKCRVAFA